jgi:hypothetical protein
MNDKGEHYISHLAQPESPWDEPIWPDLTPPSDPLPVNEERIRGVL